MIKNMMDFLAALMLSLTMIWTSALGQRGTGQNQGIAQLAEKPEVVALEGRVVDVTTVACEQTTGRERKGVHFTVLTADGKKLTIHLGPEARVQMMAKELTVDQEVSVNAFRTDRLPDDSYIAKSVTAGDKTIQVRDDNLRPVWAGAGRAAKQNGRGRWSAGNGPAAGPGGCTACMGARQGRGCCAAAGGPGAGRGFGRGAGMGRGPGAGRGRGMGRGAGAGGGPPASTGA